MSISPRRRQSHDLFFDPANRNVSAIPRHREIFERLVAKVCKDLGVPKPEARLTRRDGLVYSLVATDLTLYSRAMCSWCIDAKDYLSERGYQFTEIDVGRDRDSYEEMAELSDQTYVPTLVAGDEVLANFDTDQLEKFLSEHGIEP